MRNICLALVVSILLMMTTHAVHGRSLGIDPKKRYYVNTLWSYMQEAMDPELNREYIEVTKSHGFNSLSICVHWKNTREDGTYDFSEFDRVVERALDNGLHVFVRVNTSLTWGHKPYWLKEEHMACERSGKVFIRDLDKSGFPSISNREVLQRMEHFYEAVGRHCREKWGGGRIIVFTAAFSLYLESEYWEQIDYSPSARNDFRWWVKREYPSLADLNSKWGTDHKSWDEVDLVTAHPTAQQLYFEYALKRFFYMMNKALKKGDPIARFGMQTGCLWDNAPSRRTANSAKFFDHMEWLFVADAPIYPHRFTCDYLRGISQGRVGVANEIDGPYQETLTNEVIYRQGLATWEQGVNVLFICNWNLGNIKDPQFTSLGKLGELAKKPATIINADRAIYVSVWDLNHGGWGSIDVYRQFYDRLPGKDKRPVDIINDGVFDTDPKVLQKYEAIYMPRNEHIPAESRQALLAVKDRLRIEDPTVAGTLDEYGRPTSPFAELVKSGERK